MSDTWAPGDPFQLAALGDRYDGITGRVRGLWTDLGGREHAHVTHDDGTFASWQTARLERPDSATHAPSPQAGLASIIPSTGAVTAPTPSPVDDSTPSLVEMDRREDEATRTKEWERVMGAALEWEYADSAVAPPPVAMDVTEALDALRAAVRAYRESEAKRREVVR